VEQRNQPEPARALWRASMVPAVLAAAVLFVAAAAPGAAAPVDLDALAITVTSAHPREFIFTDKGAAHLAGECVGTDTRSYHGFYIAMNEVVDGWSLRLESGVELGAATAYEAIVTPDRLVRRHRLPDGAVVTETVELFDRENGFRVRWDDVPAGAFAVVPRVDMRFLWKVEQPAYETRWTGDALLLCRQDKLAAAPDPAHPQWLAIAVRGADRFEPDGRHVETRYAKDAARRAMEKAYPYFPGALAGRIPPQVPSGRVEAVFAADVDADAAQARALRLRTDAFDLAAARRARLEQLIAGTQVTTGVARDDQALAWARVSLDNLIMNQRGPGIYAGFYWFTTYWGRDTFISLPGACVTSGDFDTARTLLRGFAEFQAKDEADKREGRVPNFVTVDQVQYASIDGTWWFVRALDELWRQSGDDAFAREMAPVVFRAVAGAERHAVDAEGFLTHGDGETWMDGGGEQHPYSPRGTRAVEVQALWHRGLLTAARLAARCGGPDGGADPAAAARYQALADKVAANFTKRFWVEGRLVDHLNADGSPDRQVRPNTLLAVLASPTLFTAAQREAVTQEAARDLVRPHGVLSLTAADPAFHPKHVDLAKYHYDEAYHNGDVWLWLSGAYVSALNRPQGGFGQTRMLLDEVLDEGAVGTLQEIRDGAPAASNDEFGGATSQAWSLAELLRNVVQDYAGLRVDLTAAEPVVLVQPSLPAAWPSLTVATRIGGAACELAVPGPKQAPTLRFAAAPDPRWRFVWRRDDGREVPGRATAAAGAWTVEFAE
jgi:glycogen debranching enzyme